MAPPTDLTGYNIAIICALPMERTAVEAVLDKDYLDDPDSKKIVRSYQKNQHDPNQYIYGELAGIPVAMVVSRDVGTLNVSRAAGYMQHSFPNIAIALVVGITGGTPFKAKRDKDGEVVQSGIRLGDVIISSSMLQYDLGKQYDNGFETITHHDRRLPRADGLVSSYIVSLQGRGNAFRRLEAATNTDFAKYPQLNEEPSGPEDPDYRNPGRANDFIYPIETAHRCRTACEVCDSGIGLCNSAAKTSCEDLGCQPGTYVVGQTRDLSQIFIGPYVAGSAVMKSARKREQLVRDHEALAIEMEGAGVWDVFPTIVVKGVVDYADSHKNKVFRGYPAARAALCARAIVDSLDIGRAPVNLTTPNPVTHQRLVSIPFSKNYQFVGRRGELEVLQRRIFADQDCQTLAVVGLGGMGKTQLVLNFAYSVVEQHPDISIFWIPALSVETFERAAETIAQQLGIRSAANQNEDVKELVKRHLSTSTAGKWLLIVDNADDIELLEPSSSGNGLLGYLPESRLGVTVFTTRTTAVAQSVAGSNVLRLEKPTKAETIELLEKAVANKASLMDPVIMTELLDELERLPLAITQAAAFININSMSISEYTRLLQSTDEDIVYLMSKGMRDNTRYKESPSAVATTWVVSFKQILDRDPVAADLLQFISCIEWKGIPRSILPTVKPAARTAEAIGTLCSYSFLSKQTDGTIYDMHRLVHLASRIWLRESGRTAANQVQAMMHIANIFPDHYWRNRETWRAYLPHVARMGIRGAVTDNDLDETAMNGRKLCRQVGKCLRADRKITESLHWLEKSLRLTGKLAEDNPERLISQHELAVTYLWNGQRREGISLLEHVVAVIQTMPEEDHRYHLNRLSSLHYLACAYRDNGQVKEAIQLFENLVALQQKTLGQHHPNRLVSLHELGRAYQENGQVKEAIQILENVVAAQRTLAEDHPNRLGSLHDLGRAYRENGQVKEAIQLFERIVAIREVSSEKNDPDLLSSQEWLARVYKADGQFENAIRLFKYVVAVQEKSLGEDHPRPIKWQYLLDLTYKANGQLREELADLQRLAISEDGEDMAG